jgi:DNA-binding XRE family transcriptional regulator
VEVKLMDKDKIAKKLISLRGDKTKEQVAVDLGVAYASIVSYERGDRIPRDELKIKIAKYYGLKVEDIFFNQQ